jgi:hypothetical protein
MSTRSLSIPRAMMANSSPVAREDVLGAQHFFHQSRHAAQYVVAPEVAARIVLSS